MQKGITNNGVDFKLENVLVSLHSLKPMGLGSIIFKEWRAGADPGFQVREGALKKIAPSGGRHEHFWGISCEKSRFYAKK